MVWVATKYYALSSRQGYFSFGNWRHAIYIAGANNQSLDQLLIVILAAWIFIGIMWLRALKQAKVSYKAGLKDLFFTLR